MTAQSSHPSLVDQARAGDRAAFEQLYREHVGRIHALCLRMSGDPVAAEELTQQAFIRAWQRLDRFDGRSAFGTWLHRLAVNCVLGDRRSSIRRLARVFPASGTGLDGSSRPRSVPSGVDLERAIAELPPRARHVFVLVDVEGYRHQEVASFLGTTVGTSKAQLHRARKLLREALS